MIVVFLDGQLLGYGASGVARLDVAQYLGAPSARYAGFRFEFATAFSTTAADRCSGCSC
jgi:hypothetical protein